MKGPVAGASVRAGDEARTRDPKLGSSEPSTGRSASHSASECRAAALPDSDRRPTWLLLLLRGWAAAHRFLSAAFGNIGPPFVALRLARARPKGLDQEAVSGRALFHLGAASLPRASGAQGWHFAANAASV